MDICDIASDEEESMVDLVIILTQKRLKELLIYEPNTGVFTWLVDTLRHKAGDNAGLKTTNGYFRICIDGQRYWSHRLAYLYIYGAFPINVVDHIDGNPSNNKKSNLRECTISENSKNIKIKSNNISGLVGVSFDKSRGKWLAQGRENGKKKNLGRFETREQASNAYITFAKSHYGDFYRELAI